MQATPGVVRRPSSIFRLMGAYQHQPISVGVHLGVLDDVPIWHPRTHDTKRKQCLRNLNDREYVRMGDLLVPTNSRTKDLVRSTLNTHPKKKKKLVYLFNFSEADRVLCSNCFDAYRLPMITSQVSQNPRSLQCGDS